METHRPIEEHRSGEVPLVFPKIYYFLGPETSGKSTQAELLQERTNIPMFSAGDIFRYLQSSDASGLGDRARALEVKGGYADSALFEDTMRYWLSTHGDEYKKGVIIDGAPRTVEQVDIMHDLVQEYIGDMPSYLVITNMPRSVAPRRLAQRPPRKDDAGLDIRLDRHYERLAEKVRRMKDHAVNVIVVPTILRLPNGEIAGDRSRAEVSEEIIDKLGIDRTQIRSIREANLTDGIRQVADLDIQEVGHDICTLPKNMRASAIRSYIQNVNETLSETFDTGEAFKDLLHLQEYLEKKLSDTF